MVKLIKGGIVTSDHVDEGFVHKFYTDAKADARANLRIAASSINALADVDTTTLLPESGQLLAWNGTNWGPSSIRQSGNYTHTQSIAITQWTVNHGLGTRFVDIEIIDSNGTAYDGRFDYPTINYIDADMLTVTFSENQSGWAVVSHGVTVIGDVTELANVAVSGSYLDLRDIIEEPRFVIKNSNFVAFAGKRYGINTIVNTVTATLPITPSQGDAIFFTDAGDNLQTNPLFIKTQGNELIKFCGEYYGNGITYPSFEHSADSIGFFWTGSFWMPYGITTFQ